MNDNRTGEETLDLLEDDLQRLSEQKSLWEFAQHCFQKGFKAYWKKLRCETCRHYGADDTGLHCLKGIDWPGEIEQFGCNLHEEGVSDDREEQVQD